MNESRYAMTARMSSELKRVLERGRERQRETERDRERQAETGRDYKIKRLLQRGRHG